MHARERIVVIEDGADLYRDTVLRELLPANETALADSSKPPQ